MNIVRDLPPYLSPNTYVAIDSEWFQLNQNTIHRPTSGKFACMTVCFDSETVYFIDNEKNVPEVLNRIEDAIWIIHNAKFDVTHLRRLATIPPRSRLIDTMVMERTLWNGYYTDFALNDLARRYLNVHLDKSTQKLFYKADHLTEEMIRYACEDVVYDLLCWGEQKKHVKQNDMKIWREVDLPALWAITEFEGFTLDVDRWVALAEKTLRLQKEIDDILPINPRSPKQVVPLLTKLGFKRLANSQEDTLVEAIQKYQDTKAAELAALILESRKFSKRASTYGMNIIRDFLEEREDGSKFVHCDYWVVGAETGRTSSSNPNMQNQPNEYEYRACYTPRPGNVLVICDWSQQEFCISAYVSGDKRMIDIVNSGRDIYIQMAKTMYNADIEKSDPLRRRMKAVVLGTDYGMSSYGLARKEGIPEPEAEAIINKYRKSFPAMARWMDHQIKLKSYTLTVLGRRAWLNPYSNQSERNALNNPIQGTGGDQLKKAIAQVTRELLSDIRAVGAGGIVAIPHDEIILDVPKEIATKVAEATSEIMQSVANKMCPGVKFRADPKICNNWGEKE